MKKIDILNEQLKQKTLLKVIAGLENFDKNKVKNVVTATISGNAKAVDISADEELIKWACSYENLIVFVSALDPEILAQASKFGADVLEIGNFDAIYAKGSTVSKEQVLNWTRELYSKVKDNSIICTTVPCLLPLDEQISLATQLQAVGAGILQIENLGKGKEDYYFECAKEIVSAVEIPTILSGRLNVKNIRKALDTGVNGLGVGKAVNSLDNLENMVSTVKSLVTKINQSILIN